MTAALLTASAARDATADRPLDGLLHAHGADGTAVAYPGYDAHLRALARRGRPAAEALAELVVHGARRAADRLRPRYEASGRADGHVCAAVPTALAHSSGATEAGARALHEAVGRPNLMIRVPATDPGLEVITACLSEGIGVHAVSVASLERYARLVDAVLTGLERAAAGGLAPAAVPSAVSLTTAGLDEPGAAPVRPAGLAAATVHLARRMREEVHDSRRWRALAGQGARPHRLMSDTPPGTHGHDDASAWRTLDALPAYGLCYRGLTAAAEAADLARSARRQHRTARLVGTALRGAAEELHRRSSPHPSG
ncbi:MULTISPECIES: transaldolase family protein [Streptomyces]|uniref:transaldolase family protein n=1 Tax=Streptomyces TaxID=1883 RepID=UPI00068D3400|nr:MULTISPECIES: transaldolase family protein [Streptomyces]